MGNHPRFSLSSSKARLACLLALFALASCATTPAPRDEIEADIAWTLEGEFCEPETVLPLPDGTLLISNVCGFGSKGGGFLSLLGADGRVIDWRAVDGLDSPLGMAMRGGQIFVIDTNTVKSFAWPGFTPLGETEFDAKVANDVAASSNGNIYISDTAAGRVIVLAPDGEQTELVSNIRFEGANGIEIGPGGALYVGGKYLWRVDLSTAAAERIGPEWLADIDGIEFEADGTVQVTPVGGPLIRLLENGRAQVIQGEGVSSANHGYMPEKRLALIPTGFDNTVIAVRVPETGPER